MIIKEVVKYAGRKIQFREMTAKYNLVRHCVICNERLLTGQQIYSVICFGPNGPFPNTTIHKNCVYPPPEPFDKNNPFVWAAAKLHTLWKEAQNYKHWWFTE